MVANARAAFPGVKTGFLLVLVVVILAAACGDSGVTTTTTAPTVATTRAAQPGAFVPEQPDAEAGGRYLAYADLILSETSWTIDAMGTEAWFRMLQDGALAACESYHAGAATSEAIQAVIAVSPLQSQVPSSDDVDAYDLLSAFFIGGIDAYCPALIETIYGSLFAIGFDEAWEQLTGGPAPERPVRLPGG